MSFEIPAYRPLSAAQANALAETARLHAAAVAGRSRADAMAGTLAWRTVRGAPHLVLDGPAGPGDRRSRLRVLGPRGPGTEEAKARFEAVRAEARAGVRETAERIDMQAAANRSARIGTVPAMAGRVLRALAASPGAEGVRATGAAALHAYAAAAAQAIAPGLRVDPLAPLASRIVLVSPGPDAGALCRLMRAAGEAGFSARSAGIAVGPDGYVVEVLSGDAVAPLLSGAPVRAVAAADDGYPAPIAAPPVPAFVAERLRRSAGSSDAEAALALAQARAATACPAPAGRTG